MTSPLLTDEDREALARLIWEESIAFSNPRRPRATEWEDVPVSAARQSARHTADAILAAGFRRSVVSSPDVRALIDEARAWANSITPEERLKGEWYALRLADALEASAVAALGGEA